MPNAQRKVTKKRGKMGDQDIAELARELDDTKEKQKEELDKIGESYEIHKNL